MRFGVFYELQMPKPWDAGSEQRIVHEALEQVALADRLGFDYAWCVEHHFLEEYSHCSAPEVFLAAAAARTTRIRLGHGIRQVIPNYNHPARTAEGLGMLDIISNGRLDFGIGEGATRLELGGFAIPAKEKRAMSLEAAEQIANMMVLEPYPGFDGKHFSMPCRNVIPKPIQKPHPPMWMACTNRDTIRVAARNGLGALAFAFVDPDEARHWSTIYYDIIRSDECVPLGHTVNANLAVVSAFSIHPDRAEAIRRGQDGFEFFFYAVNALVAQDARPGRSRLWESFQQARGNRTAELIARANEAGYQGAGIGTPDDMRTHLRSSRAAGVDQVIFLQQAGHNRHPEILEALELFAREVMPEFRSQAEEREARKRDELGPWIARALARKHAMRALGDEEDPGGARVARPGRGQPEHARPMREERDMQFELDGSEGRISVRAWDHPGARRVVVVSHGYGEHVERYDHVARALRARGAAVYGPDHLGHGLSAGERVLIADVEHVVDDLVQVIEHARAANPGLPVVLLGHSMGGLIATRLAQRTTRPPLAGLVLSGPAIGLGPVLAQMADAGFADLPLDVSALSRDPAVGEAYAADPLVWHGAWKATTLAALGRAQDAVEEGPTFGGLPLLWIHGTEDTLVPIVFTKAAVERLHGADFTAHEHEGGRHELFNETDKERAIDLLCAFVERVAP